MHFRDVQNGAPDEGKLVLVRLQDGTFRFGMVLKGRFANYEYHNEEFVTFAWPERITHWMEVIPPVADFTAEAEAQTPKAELRDRLSIVEAAFQAAGEMPEDVYR